jgi:hypothetical protein
MDISGVPRYVPINHFKYSEDELAEKKLAMEKMKIIYPTVNEYYAEMVYDMCKNTDLSKIEEMKQRVDANPFKYDYSNLQAELDAVKDKWLNDQVCDASQNDLFSEKVEF